MNTPNGSVKREALVVAAAEAMQVYGDTPLMLGKGGGRVLDFQAAKRAALCT